MKTQIVKNIHEDMAVFSKIISGKNASCPKMTIDNAVDIRY